MKKILTFKFIALTLFFVIFMGIHLQAQFITTWVATGGEITIPTNAASGTYNYTVTWTNLTNTGVGNGIASGRTGDYTIMSLQNNSTYSVSITGIFPHFLYE